MFKQRTYVDGKLLKTTKPNAIETVRKWLDNIEREWSKNGMFPLTPAGEFDCNNAHSVSRISLDELIVVSTSGKTIRFVNIEVK